MPKKIPYGLSNFEQLITEGYLYVDKTRYIEVIENSGLKYLVFLRPRRFGKSLFLSMLDCYYDRNRVDQFDSLFGDLYVGQNPTPAKNSYYILSFSFASIDSDNESMLLAGFTQRIIDSLDFFCQRYNLTVTYPREGMPALILSTFFSQVYHLLHGRMYVLIDEYDHFANDLLSMQTNIFKTVVSQNGFVRKTYEALKEATRTVVDRIFITGVSPVTLDSMTSGFNIAKNITMDSPFNDLMGFTEAETMNLISESGYTQPPESLIPLFRRYYNGYRFSLRTTSRIFNSDMVLFYLSSFQLLGAPPPSLIDTNVASDYGKLEKLFTLHKNPEQVMTILQDILAEKSISTLITQQFSLEKDFNDDDFKSLLFYMGLLSIEDVGLSDVFLTVPNYVIRELYFDFFAKLVRERADYYIDTAGLRRAVTALALEGTIQPLLDWLTPLFNALSNRDLIQFDEKHIKLVIMSYLIMSRIYYVKSEPELNRGYADILLLTRAGIEVRYQALIELKYIKKSDFTPQYLEQVISEGTAQIQRYSQSEELKDLPNLKKFLIVMSGTEWVHVSEVQ